MKRTLYNAFYKRTQSVFLAEVFSKTIYTFYVFGYWIRKIFVCRPEIVYGEETEVREQLALISPIPDIQYSCEQTVHKDVVDLTVIVPIYNYASVLKSCLDSIVRQETKYKYEMIFVDDGSTDGSALILEQYKSLKNVSIIRQQNQGISAARNAALDEAGGTYIMFVDCDDYLEKNAVEVFLNEAYAENYDIVEAAYYTFEDNPKQGRKYIQKKVRLKHNNYSTLMQYTGYPWGKVYKRKLFELVRFPTNAWFEDTIVKMLLFRECDYYSYLKQPLYGYRKYEGNFTEKQIKSARGLEHYWLLEWIARLSVTLGIGDAESLYLALLEHLGSIFLYRIESLDEKVQRQAFYMGGRLLEQYRPKVSHNKKIPLRHRELEKAFQANDFARWKIICKYL